MCSNLYGLITDLSVHILVIVVYFHYSKRKKLQDAAKDAQESVNR